MSLKELVSLHLTKSGAEASIDLGPGSDQRTLDADLLCKRGRFGASWASVQVENGLFLDFHVRIVSAKEDVFVPSEKSVENIPQEYVGGKMNLIEDPDEDSDVMDVQIHGLDGHLSEKNQKPDSEKSKVIFNIDFEVDVKLRLAQDKKRYSKVGNNLTSTIETE
jgi:hypothetical protein